MAEFGGPIMISKLTRPCVITSTDYSLPTLFKEIKRDALIIVDNTMLHTLVTAVAAAVEGGYFHRCGVILLMDSSVAANDDDLTNLNIKLRSLWSAGLAVLKPWTGFLTRTKEGNFSTSDVDAIAARVDQGIKRMPKLLKNPATRLVCVHRSGRTVHNGPKAPLKPKMELIISNEVCLCPSGDRHQHLDSRHHPRQEDQAPPDPRQDQPRQGKQRITRQRGTPRWQARWRPRGTKQRTWWLPRIKPWFLRSNVPRDTLSQLVNVFPT